MPKLSIFSPLLVFHSIWAFCLTTVTMFPWFCSFKSMSAQLEVIFICSFKCLWIIANIKKQSLRLRFNVLFSNADIDEMRFLMSWSFYSAILKMRAGRIFLFQFFPSFKTSNSQIVELKKKSSTKIQFGIVRILTECPYASEFFQIFPVFPDCPDFLSVSGLPSNSEPCKNYLKKIEQIIFWKYIIYSFDELLDW